MFAVMRDYPWLKTYWYIGLGAVFVVGVAFVLFDGYTQVNKGRRRAVRRAQKAAAAAAVGAPTADSDRGDSTSARVAPASNDDTRQRRTRKAE